MNYERSPTRDLVAIIEERNEKLRDAQAAYTELWGKLNFLLTTYVESPDGYFTFPDGDTWNCKEAKKT